MGSLVRPAGLFCIACIAACGSAAAVVATPCAPQASLAAPAAASDHERATASAASVAPGGTVTLTVTVKGDASFQADCAAPLQMSISDATGVTVDGPTPAPERGSRCGTVHVAAAASETYSVQWTPDASLPSGIYSVTLILGDLAPLQLAIPVRTVAGGCG